MSYKPDDFTWIKPVNHAQVFRAARLKAGLTQREVAERIGVKSKQISRWENGNCWPSLQSYKRLKTVLNF